MWAAWFLISALCTKSDLNSDNRSRQRDSLPVSYARLRTHFNATWSIRMVFFWTFKYGRNYRTAQTAVKHSRYMVFNFSSGPFSVLAQVLSGFFGPSCCSCIKEQPFCLSHASLSRAKCSLLRGRTSTVSETNLSCTVPDVWWSSCVEVLNVLGSPDSELLAEWFKNLVKIRNKPLVYRA